MSDKIAPYCKPWLAQQATLSFALWLAHYFLPIPWALAAAAGSSCRIAVMELECGIGQEWGWGLWL